MSAVNDIRLTFDRDPDRYERVRPGYPDAYFEQLFDRLPTNPAVVEVGPGTGQATAGLVKRGASVTAIEIGPNLAASLSSNYPDPDRVVVINDSFERAALPLHSFDAVVAATAYHWIDPAQCLARPHQLLAGGGWLAIIDLIQVGSMTDRGYFDRVQPIYAAFGDTKHDWGPPSYESAIPPMATKLLDSDRFDEPHIDRVPWDQTYTSAQYRDLLLTYSGIQMMPPSERDDLVDQLVAVIDDEFDGWITRPLVATLTLARARPME